MIRGHLVYIGPNVSALRILLVTMCIIAVLAAPFGGAFALLHSGGAPGK
jgi:hypothetical protein